MILTIQPLLLLLGVLLSLSPKVGVTQTGLVAETPLPSVPLSSIGQPRQGKAVLIKPAQDSSAPLSPEPASGFPVNAIDFDQQGVNTGGYYNIPPDPSGAVSATHLVNVTNTSIEWYRRTDLVRENTQLLGYSDIATQLTGFFSALNPANLTFDPKVIYDQFEDRFVVVTLERVNAGVNPSTGNNSRILLAVSDDADPNGTWHFQALASKFNVSGIDYWADYPGLAVDEDAIYITANLFAFPPSTTDAGQRLWIIPKGSGSGGLYAGGSATETLLDVTGTYATGKQPAHVFGAGGLPASPDTTDNPGTVLVGYDGLSDGSDEFVSIILVDDPLGEYGGPYLFQNVSSVGDIDNTAASMPDAPQFGGSILVETNDRGVFNAVWRDASLWTTAQVVPSTGPDTGQATAHWWQFDTSANINPVSQAYSIVQQGNVGAEDYAVGTYTFMPSIAVNSAGDLAIGFSLSASSTYAGAAYAIRLSEDTLGTIQDTVVYSPGLDYYQRDFGGSQNRWGDYSATVVDPADDLGFLFFNEHAMEQGTPLPGSTELGRWRTSWAQIEHPFVPDLTPILTATPNLMTGATNYAITVRVRELNDIDTEGSITVFIPKDSRWTLDGSYDPTATLVGGVAVDNADWAYADNDTQHVFSTSVAIGAGTSSTFGIDATWDAGQTQGKYSITSQISAGSGSEDRIDNNVDAEVLDYFIN